MCLCLRNTPQVFQSAPVFPTRLCRQCTCLLLWHTCVVLTRQDAQWKQTRLFHRGVNLIYSHSTWTFAVTDTPASSPIKQVKAEHVDCGSAGNWGWHSARLSCLTLSGFLPIIIHEHSFSIWATLPIIYFCCLLMSVYQPRCHLTEQVSKNMYKLVVALQFCQVFWDLKIHHKADVNMLSLSSLLSRCLCVGVCECTHHVRTGDESVIQVLSSRLFPLNRGPNLMVIVAISM